MAEDDESLCSGGTSKHLLYSEMFSGNLEEKLRIVGKKGKDSTSTKTFRPPPSSVLSKVRDFLPQLASANEELQSLPPSDISIENTDEHDGPLIEMSLALVPGMPSDAEDSSEESDDDSSSDSDSCEDPAADAGKLSFHKDSGKKHKPSIEVLPDTVHVLNVPDG